MGNEHAKPSERVRHLEREVNSVRASVRSSKRGISKDAQEHIIQDLAKYSSEANALRGRIRESRIDDIQRNISYAMNEVLTKQPSDPNLDQGAVETNSFVQMPLNKRHSTSKGSLEIPAKKTKNGAMSKTMMPSLQDIEYKLKTLKPQISLAIESKDTTQLRVHQETVRVLATDLEMIDVPENSPLGERKEKLVSSLTSQYQKINKTMKEIKRNKDINYLAKQNMKDKVAKELEEIRQSLEENDLILRQYLKNGDISSIQNIQERLTNINQKLVSIIITDEDSRAMKMQMKDKIDWLFKHIEENIKKGYQSDLSKAQSNYEDIIKTIASGQNKDKDDIKVKLWSLQSFVDGIKNDDESSLRRKNQLLNNIGESFAIVDKNERELNKCLKDTEKLLTSWNILKRSIKSPQIEKDELLKVDRILEQIQNSIADTREAFKNIIEGPVNLKSKLNFSAPNLSAATPVHISASSLSVDRSDNWPIKLRARVFNLPTPKIQNIQEQTVLHVAQNQDANRFSKIEEIKTQVNYIKEKFTESQHKQHLKNKLESYVDMLQGYVNHENQATSNNARILLNDIQELLKTFSQYNTTNQRRISIEDSFENVVAIQEKVEEIETIVEQFHGTIHDKAYVKTNENLTKLKSKLESVDIPAKYDMINQQKIEIIRKINHLLDVLYKKGNNIYFEDPVVTNTKQTLVNLKEKVNRFSGAYKGVLYNKIEKELNKLLLDTSEKVENKQIAEQVIKDTEKYLNILEHRSTRDQSFRHSLKKSKSEEEQNLSKLKTDLQSIKKGIDSTPTNGVNLFLGLKSRLDLVKLGLDQLKELREQDDKQKDILYNEVEILKSVVDAKLALSQQGIKHWPLEQDRIKKAEEELNKVEVALKGLKYEIENFVGTTSDNKFYELDESSIRLILKMDEMQFPKESELYTRKINLLKDICVTGDLLDKRAKDTEELIQYERDIRDIENNFERYCKSTKDLEKLADRIKMLKLNLDSNEFNTPLKERQRKCSYRMEEMVEKIQKKTYTEITKFEGDLKTIFKEIEAFSGTHVDNKYNELKSALSELFSKLDGLQVPEESKLAKTKEIMLSEIRIHTNTLDNKVKDTEVYSEIKNKLEALEKKLRNTKDNKQDLRSIDKDLKGVKFQLDKENINDKLKNELYQIYDGVLSKYNIIYQRNDMSNNYIGSASFIADLEKNKTKTQHSYKDNFETKLFETEQELNELKQKISAFDDVEESDEYKQLDDSLIKLNTQIKNLDVPKDNQLYRRKLEIKQNIIDCLTLLDDKVQCVESIVAIENELEGIYKKIEFSLTEEEKNVMDEKLISLQVKLGKLAVNEDLRGRKNMCSSRVINCMKQLHDSSQSEQSGTSV